MLVTEYNPEKQEYKEIFINQEEIAYIKPAVLKARIPILGQKDDSERQGSIVYMKNRDEIFVLEDPSDFE